MKIFIQKTFLFVASVWKDGFQKNLKIVAFSFFKFLVSFII